MDVPRAIQHLSACWCASFRPDLPSPALTWGVCGSVCFILPIHRWRDQTWSNRTVNYGSMLMGCSAHARHTHVWLHMLVWKIRHIDSYAIFGCSIPSELHFCPRSHKDALYIHLDLFVLELPRKLAICVVQLNFNHCDTGEGTLFRCGTYKEIDGCSARLLSISKDDVFALHRI